MKTPTQEAMQWVWEQRQSTNSKDAISALDAVYQHLQKVTLEKEKEVMCDFVEYCDEANRNYQDTEESWCEDLTIDDMFDKRFNTISLNPTKWSETFNTNQENSQDSTNGYTYYPQENKTVFNTKEK